MALTLTRGDGKAVLFRVPPSAETILIRVEPCVVWDRGVARSRLRMDAPREVDIVREELLLRGGDANFTPTETKA